MKSSVVLVIWIICFQTLSHSKATQNEAISLEDSANLSLAKKLSSDQEKMIEAVKNEVQLQQLSGGWGRVRHHWMSLSAEFKLFVLSFSQNYEFVARLAAEAKQRKEYEQVVFSNWVQALF
jgi:hypothetical protein